MNRYKYKHGITLVEILVVVTIIAILTTMVIGIASRINDQSKERGLKSTFTLLESALQEYCEGTGKFPEQPEKNYANALIHSEYFYGQLDLMPESRKILEKVSDSLIKHDFDTGTIPPVPEIYDPWGMVIDYIYVAGDNFPDLVSAGPDKIFGTADDISSK
jgi:prepilin-type N-terminal cleavage/methylation domain-containing protein